MEKNILLQKALKLIQIRPYSEGELSEKLKKEFPNEAEKIVEVLSELKDSRLINDAQLAELFVNHWAQKNVGRMRIYLEARKKKLEERVVEEILLESGWSEMEAVQKALQFKQKTLTEKEPQKRKQKMMRFLQSRGFGSEIIFKVLE